MTLPNFPQLDLFSAAVNALAGVLIARNKSHNRGYTFVGLIVMAYFGGIGGGVVRDIILNDVPAPLKDYKYPLVCLLMGLLGLGLYRFSLTKEEHFRTRMLAFFKSFSLPWFAILGAHKALDHGIGIVPAILIGLIATTAGGVLIDLFSGVTPEIVMPNEQLVAAALLASTVYVVLAVAMKNRTDFFPITLISVLVSFTFRVFAVRNHWPSIVPHNPPPKGSSAQA